MKTTKPIKLVFRELVKQLSTTQKLLMWDLLFKTFPPPSGKWKWRWYTGTFKCTRVLFIWEMLKPEALLQLFLPRAILSLYSRGNHTSIYNTRHAFTHTSDGETEKEREREKGQDQKERLSGNPATTLLLLYSKCMTGKLLERNKVHLRTPWFSRLNTQHACYRT